MTNLWRLAYQSHRGYKTSYIRGLTAETKDKLQMYLTRFEADLIADDTVNAKQQLIL